MALSLLNDGLIRDALLAAETPDVAEPRLIIIGDSFGAAQALAEPEQRGKDVLTNGILDIFISPLRLGIGFARIELWVVNSLVEAEQRGNGMNDMDITELIKTLKDVPASGPIATLIVADFCNLSGFIGALRIAQNESLKDIPKLLYVFNTAGSLPTIDEKQTKRSGVEGFLELVAMNIGATISSSRTELPMSSADRNAWRDELRGIVVKFLDQVISKEHIQRLGMQGLEINMETVAKMLHEVDISITDSSDSSVAQCLTNFIIPVFGDSRQQIESEKIIHCPYSDVDLITPYKSIAETKSKKVPKGIIDMFQRPVAQSPHTQQTQSQQQEHPRTGLLAGVAKLEENK